MIAVGLAALCAVAWGASDYVGGLRSRRLPVLSVAFLMVLGGAASSFFVILGTARQWPGATVVPLAAAAGLTSLLAVCCVYYSLSIGPMGIMAPILGSYPVVPVMLGLLLDERPSTLQLAGMALAVVSVIVVSYARPAPGLPRISRIGIAAAALAALFSGVSLFLVAEASRADPFWTTALMRCFAVGGILLVPAVRRRRPAAVGSGAAPGGTGRLVTSRLRPLAVRDARGLSRADVLILIGIGVLDTLGLAVFGYATSLSDLAVVAVVSSMAPLVTLLAARFMLHERLAPHQLLAGAAALIGIGMIAAG